ncbi:MAG: heavy metal translocating P-type ATPase [Clostridia bacterium]|nr:heavy metal translocating P-type ATPase [Clostridia bacterium]
MNSLKGIREKEFFDENFLMLIATIGAFLIGESLEAVLVMILYKLGEALSDYAVDESEKSIEDLLKLNVKTANLKTDDGHKEINVEDIKPGDILVVMPGDKIPVDGNIVSGETFLDTSSITGESVPMEASFGDKVFAGMINTSKVVEVKATTSYDDSEISKMIELIQNSLQSKTKTEKFITKFARVYTPVVVLLAVLLAVIPSIINGGYDYAYLYKALSFLVISCPCALVLSIPLGYFAGIGRLSKDGILLKGTNIFEELVKTNAICFDKTGTLTSGNLEVERVFYKDEKDKDELVKLSLLAEYNSVHPIANAIKEYADDNDIKYDASLVKDAKEDFGKGVTLELTDGRIFIIGNEKLLNDLKIEYEKVTEVGTVLYLAIDNVIRGYIVIADKIKPTTETAISSIKKLGINNLVMLTGDNNIIAKKVADEIGISDVKGELLPEGKVEVVKSLKEEGKHVMFIGDGVNDAPCLATADSSVCMGALGSDISIDASDVIFANDDLRNVSVLLRTSKKVKRVVLENIYFSIFVKVLFLALITFTNIHMLLAVFADVGVTFICVLNSLRILRK